jgi:hypothetical protein
MIVSIHQPNYLPWLGYFRKIAVSDTFVYFDNVQMPGGKSFTSRNAIKGPQGQQWLTVPVSGKGKKPIGSVEITDQHWRRKHLRAIEVNYRGTPHFQEIYDFLEHSLQQHHEFLAEQNIFLIEAICRLLGLDHVRFKRASEMAIEEQGAESILPIIRALEASVYVTGQGAGSMRHLRPDDMKQADVAIKFVSADFSSYPQAHGDFVENLSIIDAFFNIGLEGARALLLPDPPASVLSNAALIESHGART